MRNEIEVKSSGELVDKASSQVQSLTNKAANSKAGQAFSNSKIGKGLQNAGDRLVQHVEGTATHQAEKGVAKDIDLRVKSTPDFKAVGNTKKPMNEAGEYIDFKKLNELELLDRKYRAHIKAQKEAVQIKELPDGRVRYYGPEDPSDTIEFTRGRSFVTEYNSGTGRIRTWMELYDHTGNVNRVHPKMTNGINFNSQHYPQTGAELKLLSK